MHIVFVLPITNTLCEHWSKYLKHFQFPLMQKKKTEKCERKKEKKKQPTHSKLIKLMREEI